MQPTTELSSGSAAFDALIEGVRVGDNLVVVTTQGLSAEWLVDRFVDTADPGRLVVVDATGRRSAPDRKGLLLDWSGGGEGPAGPLQARAELSDADQRVGSDALFAFDSLSALARAWGDEAALDLFLWACPRLYRRRSIALWLVDRDALDDSFLRRLTEITQVVVAMEPVGDGVLLRVDKADGRHRGLLGHRLEARVVDGDLVDVRPSGAERQRLAEMLRSMRTRRGIGQAELARQVGISPSALSQAERGVRGVSAETLTRLWEALGVPFGPDDPINRGYRVRHRGSQTTADLGPGVVGRQLSDEPQVVWFLDLAPRAAGRQALFPVKGTETVTVLSGVLRLEVGTSPETLQEGDTLIADRAAIGAWSNPADTAAEVLWIIST